MSDEEGSSESELPQEEEEVSKISAGVTFGFSLQTLMGCVRGQGFFSHSSKEKSKKSKSYGARKGRPGSQTQPYASMPRLYLKFSSKLTRAKDGHTQFFVFAARDGEDKTRNESYGAFFFIDHIHHKLQY